jgi:protein-tyrosine phosphatase
MIDIHCHLLPGIDDGPATLEAAMALAAALVEDGVTQVVCTPHVFPGRFENRRSSIAEEFLRLSQLVQQAGLPLELLWAGEVRLTPEVLDLLPLQELPFLGQAAGMKTLLLEMPDGQVPLGAEQFVRRLMNAGIRPVIAHPERNRMVMDKPERMQPLVDEGCALQLTAGSLVGDFGVRAETAARELLDQGWVQAVASDAHNLGGRKPRMKAAAQWLVRNYGQETALRLTTFGPGSLCGDNLGVNAGLGTKQKMRAADDPLRLGTIE